MQKGSGIVLVNIVPDPFSKPSNQIKSYHHFNISASEYARKSKENDFPRPDTCPFCGTIGTCLIGWGYYQRGVTTGDDEFQIPIKRWLCKITGSTVSIMPVFLVPYKRFSFAVIYQVLVGLFLQGLTIVGSLKKVVRTADSIPSHRAVQLWVKSMKKGCGYWIGILHGELGSAVAQPDTFHRDIEMAHLMTALEIFFEPDSTWQEKAKRHAQLWNRYRGSPLTACSC